MTLDEEDVAKIVKMLPAASEMLPDFPGLLEKIEDGQRKKLFACAAGLQVAIFALREGVGLPTRTRAITLGFIPIGPAIVNSFGDSSAYPHSDSFAFGVSVHAELAIHRPEQEVVDAIELAGRKFPVIVTRSILMRDGLPPHPGSPTGVGSSACWVKSTNSSSGWTHGVMTARHVVKGLKLGTAVTLDPSAAHKSSLTGWIADDGICSIDAAIIEIDPVDWPAGLRTMTLAGAFGAPIAANDHVVLDGRFASGMTGKVISHHPLPHYWGSMMGQRLVIDIHGVAGDSGSLVCHTPTGDGIGLYMGRITDGAGGFQGLCQDLYQASVYLEAEPYE